MEEEKNERYDGCNLKTGGRTWTGSSEGSDSVSGTWRGSD